MKNYKIIGHRGITDLKGSWPGRAAEWWTDKDWADWHSSKPANDELDAEYIANLKSEGRYGEEFTSTLSLQPYAALDESSIKPSVNFTSFKLIFLGDE